MASAIALDPLGRAMRLVLYRRTARASKKAGKYGAFSSFFFCMATPQSAGAIRREYLPDDSVQWLQVKPWTPYIGRYWRCCASASSRASKRTEEDIADLRMRRFLQHALPGQTMTRNDDDHDKQRKRTTNDDAVAALLLLRLWQQRRQAMAAHDNQMIGRGSMSSGQHKQQQTTTTTTTNDDNKRRRRTMITKDDDKQRRRRTTTTMDGDRRREVESMGLEVILIKR